MTTCSCHLAARHYRGVQAWVHHNNISFTTYMYGVYGVVTSPSDQKKLVMENERRRLTSSCIARWSKTTGCYDEHDEKIFFFFFSSIYYLALYINFFILPSVIFFIPIYSLSASRPPLIVGRL